MPVRIVWFRRDLRVADNPALLAATAEASGVLPLFVLDERLLASSRIGRPRLAYLAGALPELDRGLRRLGGRLVVRRGDPRDVVPLLARETAAEAVHFAADVTPYARSRDAVVAARLAALDVSSSPSWGTLVHPPGAIRSAAGEPYRVFSPFFRAWRSLRPRRPLSAPRRLAVPDVATDPVPQPADLGAPSPSAEAGERAAHARLTRFLAEAASTYVDGRDRLAEPGTSRLSTDLKYGCLSPCQVLDRLDGGDQGHEAFARQLAWRDFAAHVMHTWPEVAGTEFVPSTRHLPWRQGGDDFDAWAEGRTGYPLVDSAMRQLLAEGWMPNRARMVVAGFLCKHLRIDWRLGEAHFLRHLVDGDVANNNLGWQWAAGTGTDAQPFFRMFNPVAQGTRHDPEGRYVRRHVPELSAVPDRWLHQPWDMPPEVQARSGVRLGVDYPLPIVDHQQARREALDWFQRHRS